MLWNIIKHFNEMNQEERDRALLEITTPGSYQDDKQTQQQNENFIMNKIKCRKLLDDSRNLMEVMLNFYLLKTK